MVLCYGEKVSFLDLYGYCLYERNGQLGVGGRKLWTERHDDDGTAMHHHACFIHIYVHHGQMILILFEDIKELVNSIIFFHNEQCCLLLLRGEVIPPTSVFLCVFGFVYLGGIDLEIMGWKIINFSWIFIKFLSFLSICPCHSSFYYFSLYCQENPTFACSPHLSHSSKKFLYKKRE